MKINRRSSIYFLALGLYLIAKDLEISSAYFTYSWMPQFLLVLRYTSYLMIIAFSAFMADYSPAVLKRYLVFISFLFLISYIAGSVTILFNFMFIFGAKDIPTKKMIKYVVAIQAVITCFIFMGSMTGIIEDWTYMIDGRFRHSMGYGYPNSIPSIYFYTMIAVFYLLKDKIKIWHVVIFEVLNYVLFYFTNTRTAFALTAIALVVLWALKFWKRPLRPGRINRLLYVHSVFLIALFAILACYFYTPANPFLRIINGFISNRLSMGHQALMVNRLTLFGQKIQWYGFGGLGYTITELAGEYNNVDCSYVKILLDNGIVMLMLAVGGFMIVANDELKKGDRYFCIALLFANLYAMIEPRYIETGFNPFVWCLSALIVNRVYIGLINKPHLGVKRLMKKRFCQPLMSIQTIDKRG